MSYILEALKKLEQKRRRDEKSHVIYMQPDEKRPPAKRLVLQYCLFAALCVNAGLFFWWLHPLRSGKPAVLAETSVSATPARSADNAMEQTKTDTGTEETGSGGVQTGSSGEPEGKSSVASAVPAAAESAQLPRQPTDAPASGQKVIEMSELPLSVSQGLPDLTISGHFYGSRAASRVVTIGGRMLHEGAAAAPGIKLEKITRDGAVFSYQGYRFRKGVF